MQQKSEIQSRVLKTELINWRELQFIQNDNFKELPPEARHKLKASIVANNFTQPFYIWESNEGAKKPYCEEILTQFAEANKCFQSNGFAKAKVKNKRNK